jgi:hypothetical protein
MAQVFKASFNPTLPQVSIEIGGKERPMAFCYAAIAHIEGRHQKSIGQLLGQMDMLSIAADLLHAALLRDDPKLTVDEVSNWVHFSNLLVIQQALLAAWFGSLPDKKDDEEPGEDKAQTPEV